MEFWENGFPIPSLIKYWSIYYPASMSRTESNHWFVRDAETRNMKSSDPKSSRFPSVVWRIPSRSFSHCFILIAWMKEMNSAPYLQDRRTFLPEIRLWIKKQWRHRQTIAHPLHRAKIIPLLWAPVVRWSYCMPFFKDSCIRNLIKSVIFCQQMKGFCAKYAL